MKVPQLIAFVALAGFVALLLLNFAGEMSTYTDFKTAQQSAGQEVHVIAKWVNREQATYDPQRDLFSFELQDSLGTTQRVHYYDPKPANFDNAERILVVGKYEESVGEAVFVADKILMKCPSKYQEDEVNWEQPKYYRPEGAAVN